MDDPQPLIAAYLRKRADLVRFFSLRTGSAAMGEDLVQDLYLKISASEPPAELHSPEAYLYRVGTNLMLDRIKQQRRQSSREDNWDRETRRGDAPEAITDSPSPEDALDSRARLARLLAALDTLPPQVAAAFRLHKFEGLSHGETAERLGVSRSSVEKYMMSALKHLLARMDP